MYESSKATIHRSFITVHADNISREIIKAALRGELVVSYPINHNDIDVLVCVKDELINRFPDSEIKLLDLYSEPNIKKLIVVNWV
jgi:hypothetical protein